MSEIDDVLKHAQLAHFDNEVSSMVILMVVKGEPEAHMAITQKAEDVFAMNAAIDMFKGEMLGLMSQSIRKKEDRQ